MQFYSILLLFRYPTMSLKAALPSKVLATVQRPASCFVRAPAPLGRKNVIAHAEINTEDTPGVSSLLDRDFK